MTENMPLLILSLGFILLSGFFTAFSSHKWDD